MQRLWYSFLRVYVRIGLHIYFRKISIHGLQNIPEGPVIFAANHQNSFMDALLIVCFNTHITHFLTRADIFRRPFFNWLLSTLNMIPVYRIRDGWQLLAENQKTFEACNQVFLKNETVVIFPEGNHDARRRLRPLSKGFTKVAFESLLKNPDLKISIVPVGLNYTDHQAYGGSVSIIFGESILANDYFNNPSQNGSPRLRNELEARMKRIITHVEDADRYPEIIRKLEFNNPDYLDPFETNKMIAAIEKGDVATASSAARQPKKSGMGKLLYLLSWVINFIPLLIWIVLKINIKDPVFVPSLKFGVGIFLFPVFYLLMAVGFYWSLGLPAAIGWLVLAFISLLFLKRP